MNKSRGILKIEVMDVEDVDILVAASNVIG